MTRSEFVDILSLLTGAYPSFDLDDHQMDTWYEFLGRFNKANLEKVVRDYIIENPKSPAISDFYGRCDKRERLGVG